MREILFRGIPKEKFDGYAFTKIWGDNCEGNFVYGSLLISDDKYYICVSVMSKINCCINNGMTSMIEVIPESVSEFTGLTDKNGKKVFEGDIVKFGKHLYQIIFECGSFALLDKHGEMISKIGGMNDHCYSFMNLYLECCWEDDCAYDIEVIGNIHDNSELLEGAE